MADPVEPTPDKVAAALDSLVALAMQRATEHHRGAGDFASHRSDAVEMEQWAGAFTAAARLIHGLVPREPLHEWKCPACGATTRARMADYQGGGQ